MDPEIRFSIFQVLSWSTTATTLVETLKYDSSGAHYYLTCIFYADTVDESSFLFLVYRHFCTFVPNATARELLEASKIPKGNDETWTEALEQDRRKNLGQVISVGLVAPCCSFQNDATWSWRRLDPTSSWRRLIFRRRFHSVSL